MTHVECQGRKGTGKTRFFFYTGDGSLWGTLTFSTPADAAGYRQYLATRR